MIYKIFQGSSSGRNDCKTIRDVLPSAFPLQLCANKWISSLFDSSLFESHFLFSVGLFSWSILLRLDLSSVAKQDQIPTFLTVCSCHVTYAFQSESTLYSCLNVKELLARSRCEIWRWSDCNWTRTQNHILCWHSKLSLIILLHLK